MYRRPGDLKWRGRRPKQQNHHGRGFAFYRYASGGFNEFRRMKNKGERRRARLDLRRGLTPEPLQARSRAKWDWL